MIFAAVAPRLFTVGSRGILHGTETPPLVFVFFSFLIKKKNFRFICFVCMGLLLAHLSVQQLYDECPQRQEEHVGSPEIGGCEPGDCEPPCGCRN